jgi:GT2 family glycosyltransferase
MPAPFSLADVTVVIVSFNSAAVLPGCLASLPAGVALCVIDNASTDDSVAVVARLAPSARVLRQAVNLGFGRGANAGFAAATTRYGLLLNPDTRCAPGMVEALLAAAARYPDAGLLAPATTDEAGRLQFGHLPIFDRHRNRGTPVSPEGDCCAAGFQGHALLFPLAVFRAIGGFDAAIFLYYEDDDLCLRLRRAGHALVHVAAARLTHAGAGSSAPSARLERFKEWHMGWSRQHLVRTYRGRGVAAAHATAQLAETAGKLAFRLGDPRRVKWAARARGTLACLVGQKAVDFTEPR